MSDGALTTVESASGTRTYYSHTSQSYHDFMNSQPDNALRILPAHRRGFLCQIPPLSNIEKTHCFGSKSILR